MKKALLFIATIAFATVSQAGIWRVNNNTGVNADFTDLPAAETAAVSGDTIYLEPSNTAYSNTSLDKELVIIGNGYFNNGFPTNNPGLQADTRGSHINGLQFYAGSDGSVVMGLTFQSNAHIYADDITIKRCYFNSGSIYLDTYNPFTGLHTSKTSADIRQNFFGYANNIYNYYGASAGITFSGISIQNNIFQNYSSITLPSGFSGFIQNNVFDEYYNYSQSISVYNFQINNNILLMGIFYPNNNVYFNNISDGTQFGTANNNQQNISTTALFSNYAGPGATETRYQLLTGGPGVGAGFNGVDIGIFGGPDPYKLSGIPPVPTIYQLTAPATTTTNTLQVTISTRSNN